jgi:hypothetical protein
MIQPDPFVHFVASNLTLDRNATALCGKVWEFLTDDPNRVNCPDCKKEMEKTPCPK